MRPLAAWRSISVVAALALSSMSFADFATSISNSGGATTLRAINVAPKTAVSLLEERGAVVALGLVAPWCGECAAFANSFGEAAAEFPRDAGNGAAFSAFLVTLPARRGGLLRRRAGDPAAFGTNSSQLPLLLDQDADWFKAIDPAALPWVVLLNQDGDVVLSQSALSKQPVGGWAARAELLLRLPNNPLAIAVGKNE